MCSGASTNVLVVAFSGDEAGQGWGINEAWGGYRVYEAMRRFNADRSEHMADPDFYKVPVSGLLSKAYIEQLRNSIERSMSSTSRQNFKDFLVKHFTPESNDNPSAKKMASTH